MLHNLVENHCSACCSDSRRSPRQSLLEIMALLLHFCSESPVRDKLRSSDILKELGVELLHSHAERCQVRWFRLPGCLPADMRQTDMTEWEEAPGTTTRGIIYLIWPGNVSRSPRKSWRMYLWGRMDGPVGWSILTKQKIWKRNVVRHG